MVFIIYAVLLLIIVVAGVSLGQFLPLHLPYLHSAFDRKPFNCRPCCTFHLIWIPATFAAYAIQCFPCFVVGLTVAFIIFFITKYIDNKKIEK